MARLQFAIKAADLTPEANWMIGNFMFEKGRCFLRGGVLLNEKEDNEFVVLHCFCQGFENCVKGLLLMKDYSKYEPMLKWELGHDLVKMAHCAYNEFGLNSPAKALLDELIVLNNFYKHHLLRYGTMHDLLMGAPTIKTDAFLHTMTAVFRLARYRIQVHYGNLLRKGKN